MLQSDIEREVLSFDEKISLAKLEEAKAAERVRELEYQKSRFLLESYLIIMKQQQEALKAKMSEEETKFSPEMHEKAFTGKV